jgi:hypothetical protein
MPSTMASSWKLWTGLQPKYVGARHQQNLLGLCQFLFRVSVVEHDRGLGGAFAAAEELGRDLPILDFIEDE